jgi:hypothetical protein
MCALLNREEPHLTGIAQDVVMLVLLIPLLGWNAAEIVRTTCSMFGNEQSSQPPREPVGRGPAEASSR